MDEDYKGISEKVWFYNIFNKRRECGLTITGVTLFLRYVEDIIRYVKGDPSVVSHAANNLHTYLQFTLETPNENVDLAFLDVNITVDGSRKNHYQRSGHLKLCRKH